MRHLWTRLEPSATARHSSTFRDAPTHVCSLTVPQCRWALNYTGHSPTSEPSLVQMLLVIWEPVRTQLL